MWHNTWYLLFFSYIAFSSSQLIAGTVIKEECPSGLSLEAQLDDNQYIQQICFSDGSRICYEYDNEKLFKITRYDSFGNELYSQSYHWNGIRLENQTGWFTTNYIYDDCNDRIIAKINPWHQETIEYDSSGKAIRIGDKNYSYDDIGQITSENDLFRAVYDSSYNLIEFNRNTFTLDEDNKIIGYDYDLNGNLLAEKVTYGENNLISEAYGNLYLYDSHGRLVQKGNTCYLYLGSEEIASFENGQCKTLKVPGIGGPIAIEIDGKPYAPVIDATGIIRKLIDPVNLSIYKENNCDIFGRGLTDSIPYTYRGKHYDPLTGLIYFGKRFYDPSLQRWLSPDPLGSVDHENLYQYVYNNPLKYHDPTGCSFWGYALGIGEIIAGGTIMLGGMGLEIVTMGGFTFGFTAVEGSGLALITDGLIRATQESQSLHAPKWDKSYENQTFRRYNADELGAPPVKGDELIGDGSISPGQGFDEWKGKGPPESGKGSWVREIDDTIDSVHPDLNHPGHGPHWDYVGPDFPKGARLYPDGTWEEK